MPAAAPLPIAADDLAELRRWARSSQLPAVLAQRARILLLAADGPPKTEPPQGVGAPPPPVTPARRGCVRRGVGGSPARPRPGRPQTGGRTRRTEILQVTLNPPPAR